MPGQAPLTRRSFLQSGAAAAAVTLAARRAQGRPPSGRTNVGYVGAGTQGLRQLMDALGREDLRITAVCDPNRLSDDYVEWFRNELRDKVRGFLGSSSWGEGARGCPAGREVGRQLVDHHYGASAGGGCAVYADFREMLAEERDLDAVYVMTPDHLHAAVSLAALAAGKHVIVHKPLGNVLREARLVADAARRSDRGTHMFCGADAASTAQLTEWIEAGAIGPVREVHNWSARPYWPQGMTTRPEGRPPVPEGLDWDLWLGPVPHLPYHPAYTHAVFRGWYDFGTGALGDMGHYSFFQIFRILKLGAPLTVEASRSQEWRIEDLLWVRKVNALSYPRASTIHWEFAAREGMPPVSLHWYDGGLRPPTPRELTEDGEKLPEEGLLFVGDDGKILGDFRGREPRLIPKARMGSFAPPPERLPRPRPELDQWVGACRGEAESDASFTRVARVGETILLGNIALRVPRKLRWNAEAGRFAGDAEADALMTREYREGWTL